MLDEAAKLFADQGKWATAVLYWQRAVGRFPGNVAILRRLADGYRRLGFADRSIDTLQSAKEKTKDPQTRQAIIKQIEAILQKSSESDG